MKRILFALLAVFLLASGCSKEKSEEDAGEDTNYFVRFRAGSDAKEFRNVVIAVRSSTSGVNTLTIEGGIAPTGNGERIVLGIAEAEPIVAQTYAESPNSDSPAILYRNATAVEFSNLFMATASGLTVTISDINQNTVRGTFSGRAADLDGNEIQISDGAFFAKFQ